jgi:dihydrofolate reductase
MNLIVAVSRNGVIGLNGKMPWHLPKDLQYFKKITLNNTVIMGRFTFEAIGKPLPNRKNIVLSKKYNAMDGVWVAHSWEEISLFIQENEQIFVIGGQQIFEQALNQGLIKKIYRTFVHHDFDGDTFFPNIDKSKWKLEFQEFHHCDLKNPYDLTFEIWNKI